MYLAQLRAENFRALQPVSLHPHRRLNLMIGANAAGKTSLLEAIYCLGRAKSFRSTSPADMAGAGGRHWMVSGSFVEDPAPAQAVRVAWDATGTHITLNHQTEAPTAELVRGFPVQVMEPGMHRLLQEGPGYRRSFLDWGVFHVEHQFLPAWRRFQRALKQRNHALRARATAREISTWNPELAEAAAQVHQQRSAHVEQLRTRLGAYIQRLLGIGEWELDLLAGWSAGSGYAEVLERELERDRALGATLEGPQRAELRIRLQQHKVKHRISRGQQKLLICALILAQTELIREHGRTPVLLLDDFGAEIAAPFQQSLFDELNNYPGQVFISAFGREDPLAQNRDAAMFHVEHGQITPF